ASEAQNQSHIAQDPIVEDVVGKSAQDVAAAIDSTTVVDKVEKAQAVANEVDEVVKITHAAVDGIEVAKEVGATDEVPIIIDDPINIDEEM
ncbi:hypothetical protein Dimus_011091, partial [Dionaea muscipula]